MYVFKGLTAPMFPGSVANVTTRSSTPLVHEDINAVAQLSPSVSPGGSTIMTAPLPTPTAPPTIAPPWYRTPFGMIAIAIGAFIGYKLYARRKTA